MTAAHKVLSRGEDLSLFFLHNNYEVHKTTLMKFAEEKKQNFSTNFIKRPCINEAQDHFDKRSI